MTGLPYTVSAHAARAPRPPAITHAVVVVPARDEAALIGRCLDALDRAMASARATHPDVRVRAYVVADACTDDTAALVRESGLVQLVLSDAASVGPAREIGIRLALDDVDEAARRAAVDPATDDSADDDRPVDRRAVDSRAVWIANTDADSAVPGTWLTHQLDRADAGVDVLVGTVRPDPGDLTPEQDAAWIATHHRGRPNGHVHGANLGVRASAHLAVGGFEPVGEHEDNLLVQRLLTSGARVEASDEAEVVTSGRLTGRTPGGYAAYLAGTL